MSDTDEGKRTQSYPLTTRTDPLAVASELARTPMISAEQYSHVGRYAGALVMSVFEQMGGAPRMASWADQNPTDFYTKLFPKMISRSAQVDVSGTLTIDDAISKLDRQDEDVIDADFDEISDQLYDL
jgi:hypothetical protein